MNIFLPVIFFIVILLVLPIRAEILLNVKLKDKKVEFEPLIGMDNTFKIKVIYFITILKKDIFGKKKEKKRKVNKDKNNKEKMFALYNSVKFQRLILSLGINVYNPVVNSYIHAMLNTGLCMYINVNNNKFNFNNLYYQIYLSDVPIVLSLNSQIDVVPIKFLIEYLKQKVKHRKDNLNKNMQSVA